MAGGWLGLKFEGKGAGFVAGAAWVMGNGQELTPDCASYGELDCRLREMERDIAAIRIKGRKEFNRVQNGKISHA